MVSGYGVSSTIETRVGSCMAFLIRENAKNANPNRLSTGSKVSMFNGLAGVLSVIDSSSPAAAYWTNSGRYFTGMVPWPSTSS